jgi:integrase
MATTFLQERPRDTLTAEGDGPTVAETVERQRGFIPKGRKRVSYQKGSIVIKGVGKYLLRYRIRDASQPGGWGRASLVLDATTDKAAEKERDRRMLEINQRNETPTQPPTRMTFMEFAGSSSWLNYLDTRDAARSTRRSYSSNLDKHILPILGPKVLTEISPQDIGDLLHTIRKSLTASKSVLNIYTQLRTMFSVAEETDLIPRSPVRKKLHRPTHHAQEKQAWSAAQVRSILENVPENWLAFFACLAATTVRIGELLALTWSDMDWQNRKIRISKSLDRAVVVPHTKTRTVHLKHIPEALLRLLESHREISGFVRPTDFVFCKADGSPCDPDHLRESVLYPAVDRAGIGRVSRNCGFHAFRHAGSSIINELTGDLKLSQVQLGHKRLSTTANIYTHTNERHVERAGEVLAEAILSTK